MRKGTIHSIAISVDRGTLKQEVPEAELVENFGIKGDGHAGDWGRQVTLLDRASVQKANREHGLKVGPGGFAENILIDGMNLARLRVGGRIKLGDSVVVEVSQIGKEDHPSVVTEKYDGVSLLPHEGLFCRVITGGKIRKGDPAQQI